MKRPLFAILTLNLLALALPTKAAQNVMYYGVSEKLSRTATTWSGPMSILPQNVCILPTPTTLNVGQIVSTTPWGTCGGSPTGHIVAILYSP